MFRLALLKLTTWYLLILMLISILFSVALYNTATNEVGFRLERYRNNISLDQRPLQNGKDSFLLVEKSDAADHIILELFWQNIYILIGGGLLSYFLAKRTLDKIEEAHEAQTRFTSDASHELRTPLAVMKTEIEVVLNDEKASKQDLAAILSSNLEEVDRLTALSNMLLSLSRLDNKGLNSKKINMFNVTENAIATIGNKSKRIHNNINKHTSIIGDDVAISDLMSLLINNALKYSPPGSSVDITSDKHDKSTKITISNRGNIDDEALPYIFDRFYRADKSRNTSGFGLGLSLAKKIAKAHNGDIIVDTKVNDRVNFIISLPNA